MRDELDSQAQAAVVRMARREAEALTLVPAGSDRVESPDPEIELVVRACPECGTGAAEASSPLASAVLVRDRTGRLPSVEMFGCEQLTARELLPVAVWAATGSGDRFATRSVAWHRDGGKGSVGQRLVRLDRQEQAKGVAGTRVLPIATRQLASPGTAYVHSAHVVIAHAPSQALDRANDLYRAARVDAVSRLIQDGPGGGNGVFR